jgi:hypothetical protein
MQDWFKRFRELSAAARRQMPITGRSTRLTHFQDAGFELEVTPHQGPGAAVLRIEAGTAHLSPLLVQRKND